MTGNTHIRVESSLWLKCHLGFLITEPFLLKTAGGISDFSPHTSVHTCTCSAHTSRACGGLGMKSSNKTIWFMGRNACHCRSKLSPRVYPQAILMYVVIESFFPPFIVHQMCSSTLVGRVGGRNIWAMIVIWPLT